MSGLRAGRLKLEDQLPVTEKAWRMGGSKMFVQVGTTVAVEDLIRGIVVDSGNDACIVLAEAISGSEEQFAELMNAHGEEVWADQLHFMNATGWPADNHYMSCRDIATLAGDIIRISRNIITTTRKRHSNITISSKATGTLWCRRAPRTG